jgi:hypothetical protein
MHKKIVLISLQHRSQRLIGRHPHKSCPPGHRSQIVAIDGCDRPRSTLRRGLTSAAA